MNWLKSAILLSITVLAMGANDAEAGLPECWREFWRRDSHRAVESSKPSPKRSLTASTRAGLREWSKRRPGPVYGLDRRPLSKLRRGQRYPIVVFLHGLNSRPEDLDPLIKSVARAGHLCTTFRYPNDQPLPESARLFSKELRSLGSEVGAVQLVSHSMGGLVARSVIENESLDPGSIVRLVMLAPPNQGSAVARYAKGLDVYEFATSKARRREAGFFSGAIRDGLSQATKDLRPESAFLQQLNSRPRNPDVSYTIIAGTRGPLSSERVEPIGGVLVENRERCSWIECLDNCFRSHVTANKELFDGIGDGVVAVDRAQLPGVDDFVVGRFSHGELLRSSQGGEKKRIYGIVVSRLSTPRR